MVGGGCVGYEDVCFGGYFAEPGLLGWFVLEAVVCVNADIRPIGSRKAEGTYANSLGPISGISGTPKMLIVRPRISCLVIVLSR